MLVFNKLLNKHLHKKKIIVSSFESIIIKKNHYIYAIGINSNKKFTKISTTIWILFKKIQYNSIILIHNYIQKLLILYNQNIPLIIYSANFKNFDSYFLLKTLIIMQNYDKNYLKAKIIIKHGFVYKIKINNLVFLDSFTILNQSFKHKIILFKNQNKCYINKNVNLYNSLEYFLEFIKKDLKKTYLLINLTRWQLFFKYRIELTNCISISTMSLNIFNTKFKNSLNIYKNNILIYNIICGSYLGGLSNIYNPCLKNNTIYGYDINSLYPFIMFSKPLPIGKPLIRNKKTFIDLNSFFGFIEATVILNNNQKNNLLPIQQKSNIIQPVGYISGVWFSEEIKMMLKNKELISFKIHKIITFNKEILLKYFTKHFYTQRLKASSQKQDKINKFFMNHLSGRFGLKLINNITKFIPKNELYRNEFMFICNNLHNKYHLINNVQHKNIDLKNKHSILQSPLNISSAINAYGRCYILDLIQFESVKGNNLLFIDTDSLYCKFKLKQTKLHLNYLGFLKLESISKKTIFLNRNIYYFKNVLLKSSLKSKKKFFNILKIKNFTFKNFIQTLKKNKLKQNLYSKRIYQYKKQIWKTTKTKYIK
jgi:hypothetical protein